MKDQEQTKEALLQELASLRVRIAELEQAGTNRQRAEQALQTQEIQLNTILESTGDGILAVDNAGKVVKANQRFADIWKIPTDLFEKGSDEDLLTYVSSQLIDPNAFFQKVQELYASTDVDFDTILFKDGRTIERYSCPLLCEGVIKGRVWSFRDITDRKRAEESLTASEEKYRIMFKSSHDAIMILAPPSWLFTSGNPATIEMFEASDEAAFTAVGPWELSPEFQPDGRSSSDKAAEMIQIAMEKGSHFFEWTHRRLGGALFPATVLLTRLEIGGQALLQGTVRDITESKRAEQALTESERSLKDAQRLTHIGSWEWTIGTDSVRWSDELYNINRRDPKLPLSGFAEMSSYYTPESRQQLQTAIAKILLSSEPYELELEKILPDGERRISSARGAAVYDDEGKIVKIYGTVHDITELKQMGEEKRKLQERLKRAEKMEALGQLAGGVAHDLNNVLGVLSGYSELLVERIPAGSPLREYAAHILKSSERAAAIIQDLLTLARRGVIVSEVFNLSKTVLNLLKTPEFDKLQAYHPQASFKTNLEKDLLNIKGSPIHLEKSILNLISNAAEAIVSNGEVEIRTENRHLDRIVRGYDEIDEGDYVVLTVADSGRGISTSDLDKIFEPFYTKKSMGRSGTGLGLAIVWGTVKDHKGFIDVQSIEGRGTTFTLYFPATREEKGEDTQKIPIEQYLGHGESVLIIDDVPEQRQVAMTLLTELGYQVNALSSGEEAVEYLKQHKADILVLDMIMMPGMDGLETYQRVLETNPKQKTIIVSGFSETDRVMEAQKMGAGPYVKKPYTMEKIGLAIRDELARK